MDKKRLRNDIILISTLLLVAAISLVLVLTTRVKTNLTAKVYVQNTVVETVDLSLHEEKEFYVDGINGKVKVHVHDGAIAITESNCPHQDCVKTGYVSETNKPIICAYNAVSILIEGGSEPKNDTDVG